MCNKADPGEAQQLIELIEMLFDEWYVNHERRHNRLAIIEKTANHKKTQIEGFKARVTDE